MSTLSEYPLPLPDGRPMTVAVGVPDAPAPVPAVVVIHEVFGLTDFIRDVCHRFIAEGYAVIAPDLLSTGNRLACIMSLMREVGHPRLRGRAHQQIETARRHLAAQPGVDPEKTAVIGFCMGGGFALGYGVTSDVRAAAVNYGQVPEDMEGLVDVCPVVASYGERDAVLRGAGDRLRRHLETLDVAHDVRSYPGAGHGFFKDDHPPRWRAWFSAPFSRALHLGYRPDAAEDAWRRIFTFFDRHVRSPAGSP